jgi:hypothetical protein
MVHSTGIVHAGTPAARRRTPPGGSGRTIVLAAVRDVKDPPEDRQVDGPPSGAAVGAQLPRAH